MGRFFFFFFFFDILPLSHHLPPTSSDDTRERCLSRPFLKLRMVEKEMVGGAEGEGEDEDDDDDDDDDGDDDDDDDDDFGVWAGQGGLLAHYGLILYRGKFFGLSLF